MATAPGPALFFVVVNGVPSNASWIMVGDGIIGEHTIRPASVLPVSTIGAQVIAQYNGTTAVRRRVKREAKPKPSETWRLLDYVLGL
jgi:hypothetical protein